MQWQPKVLGASNGSYQTIIIGSLGATLRYNTTSVDITFILATARQPLSFRTRLSPSLRTPPGNLIASFVLES